MTRRSSSVEADGDEGKTPRSIRHWTLLKPLNRRVTSRVAGFSGSSSRDVATISSDIPMDQKKPLSAAGVARREISKFLSQTTPREELQVDQSRQHSIRTKRPPSKYSTRAQQIKQKKNGLTFSEGESAKIPPFF